MFIIGLIGQKRVGKDTVADIIQSLDPEFQRYALADPIKDIARIMFNFTESQLYDAEKDLLDTNWGIRPRDFFEKFGTDIMQFDIFKYLPGLNGSVPERCFWVQSLIRKIQSSNCNKIIITDVRGEHELDALLAAFPSNTKFIKITKQLKPSTQISPLADSAATQTEQSHIKQAHITQTHITQVEPELIPLDKINLFLDNNGTLDELHNKVKIILAELMNPHNH